MTVDATPLAPDERVLRAHLERASFRAGVDRGLWRRVDIAWSFVFFAISAAPREGSPNEFVFRFDLAGYPRIDPTAAPWDLDAEAILPKNKRPRGETLDQVLRTDWEHGGALYLPWDRVAIKGHDGWRQQHPGYVWDEGKDITFCLRHLHGLLNDEEYRGVVEE